MSGSDWWDEEFDVVVLGGGGAGLMAAVEAAESGAAVLLLEKQPSLGGATGMAVGSITAAGTDLQKKAGIPDDVDGHYRDLMTMMEVANRRGEEYNLELSRLMVEIAPGVIERLTGLGVQFSGPHPEPPHEVYRMHSVVPDSNSYIELLSKAAQERGVVIRTSTTVHELQRDGSGAVVAVSIRGIRSNQTKAVKVNRAVILAAGDFSANDELARQNGRPPQVSAIDPIRSYATGDGILLATAVGAGTVAMHRTGSPNFRTCLPPYCSPAQELFQLGGILVNRNGRRFTDELAQPVFASNDQPGKTAMLIFDATVAGHVATADEDDGSIRDGWYRNGKISLCTFPALAYAYIADLLEHTEYLIAASSLAQLAEKTGLPASALESDIAGYNKAVRGEQKDSVGRTQFGAEVSKRPFYAFGPIKPFLIFSGGGLSVDREMHVLDEEGRVIPHLYAAGVNGEAGVFLGGHGHHLAWAFGTGRIAGKNAAAERPST